MQWGRPWGKWPLNFLISLICFSYFENNSLIYLFYIVWVIWCFETPFKLFCDSWRLLCIVILSLMYEHASYIWDYSTCSVLLERGIRVFNFSCFPFTLTHQTFSGCRIVVSFPYTIAITMKAYPWESLVTYLFLRERLVRLVLPYSLILSMHNFYPRFSIHVQSYMYFARKILNTVPHSMFFNYNKFNYHNTWVMLVFCLMLILVPFPTLLNYT